MFLLVISQSSLNMGLVGSKTRSLGQISLKKFVHPREATVLLESSWSFTRKFVLMKSGQV